MPAPALRDLQAAFWRCLVGEAAAREVQGLVGSTSRLPAGPRLDIYRHMYAARLIDALREDFPRVAGVLGEGGFESLARSYVTTHPSTHPSLRHLGRKVPGFIETHSGAGLPAFLADLARLEWARVEVFDALDAKPLRLEELREVPPEDWGDLRLFLVPAVEILVTAWPVHEIWASDGPVADDLPPRRTALRVWREGFRVYHAAMDATEEAAVGLLREGTRFGTICEALETPEESAGFLLRWVEDGVVARGDRPIDRRAGALPP